MNAMNPNEHKSQTQNEASKVSVPDYGGGADGDMRDNRQVDPTRNAGTAAKKDVDDVADQNAGRTDSGADRSADRESSERGSGEPSRKNEIDASTDAAVKAGVGTAAALGLGAALLDK